MEPFLRTLAKALLTTHGDDLREVAVVLPSRRAATVLRHHLAASAGKAIWSPDLFTFPTFTERLTGFRTVDPLSALFIYHEVQRELFGDEAWSLTEMLSNGPPALSDMSEVDAHLVPLDLLYRQLDEFSELEEWSFHLGELSPGQIRHKRWWHRQGMMHRALNARLAKNGLGTAGMLARMATEGLRRNAVLPAWKAVWVAGANALERAQLEMLKALRQRGLLKLAWDADRWYLNEPAQEAGEALRSAIAQLGTGLIAISDALRNAPKKVDAVRVPNAVAQAYYAADVLGALSPEQRARTAVVLADEGLIQPLLAALPADIGPFNVTMGIGLATLPVATLAKGLFTLHAHAHPTKGLARNELMGVLSHPFLRGALADGRSEEVLRNAGPFLGSTAVEQVIAAAPEPVRMHVRNALRPTAGAYVELVDRARSTIAWAFEGTGANTLVREQLFAWALVLEKLTTLLARHGLHPDPGEWITLHDRVLRRERLDLEGEPLSGLQIMGFLETRALDHERLIVLSANEGDLPSANGGQSFIPFAIRQTMGLPLPQGSDAVAAYHFHRMMHQAKDVLLLHHEGTGDDQAEPSRFIMQMRHELPADGPVSWSENTAAPKARTGGRTSIAVHKRNAVLDRLHERLARGVSPSMLASFLRCPLEFHHVHVLGCARVDEVVPRITEDHMGSAVHETLREIYAPYEGRPIDRSGLRQAVGEIRTKLARQLEKLSPHTAIDGGEPLLQFEMAVQALERYLAHEAGHPDTPSPTVLIGQELDMRHVIPLSESALSEVPVKGRIDRIERRDGIVHILDIKTGSVRGADLKLHTDRSDGPGPKHAKAIQLAVYAWLYLTTHPSEPYVRAGIIPLRAPRQSAQAVLQIDNDPLITQDHLPYLGACIADLVEQMMDPASPFMHDTSNMYCTFCITS